MINEDDVQVHLDDADDVTIVRPVGKVKPSLQSSAMSQTKPTVMSHENEVVSQHATNASRKILDEITQSGDVEDDFKSNNPMRDCANVLFELVKRIRLSHYHSDIPTLRAQLIDELKKIKNQLLKQGYEREITEAALYALCAFVDETVLSTAWGGESVWARHSMLSTFYNETWGGEKFFEILNFYNRSPAANIDILELLFICMCLGFQGKYKVIANGRAQVRELRDDLFQLIKKCQTEQLKPFSYAWQNHVVDRKRVNFGPQLRFIIPGLCIAMVGLFAYYHVGLQKNYQPIEAALVKFENNLSDKMKSRNVIEMHYLNGTLVDYLQKTFRQEIDEHKLSVQGYPNYIAITLHNQGLFQSGLTEIDDSIKPLVLRIAEIINQIPAKLSVVGHTDSTPILSERFPSNYELSVARAKAVADLLMKNGITASRLTVDGKAEKEPLTSNATAEGRAKNRRVELRIVK